MASEKKDSNPKELDFNSMTRQDIINRHPELKITDVTGKHEGLTELFFTTGRLQISKPKPQPQPRKKYEDMTQEEKDEHNWQINKDLM